MMNVTKVFTYTFEINESAMKVFEYYAGIGFLEMQPIHPAKSKFGPKRGYNRPRFEQQAWVDEVMGANDCKHRMSGYDYVIVMDMDEFICPQRTLTSYYDILKEASKMKPSAGAFVFDSHVMMLDWGETRVSPIRLMRYTQRTTVPNYDGPDKNTRWAFMPRRTYYARNNYVDVKGPFTTWQVPYELYTLFHYRNCKFTWKGCKEREREEDNSMLKFEQPLLERIRHLPLKMLLFNNTNYFNYLMSWNQ
ncbi:uncharacterized protein LOC131932645 [Physella acuta]|uniref:uncharacterized protein LOC131932645 n=1 Tax=Physella acuta TaxID=109671 RepID=UPI0027DCA11D|nr:uncharacterized protein LOC131932645 [Physella acuta]